MQFIKYCMLFLVFIASALIGKYISQKYKFRVDELEEIKNALNIFKSKIKFTYEPIPEIFKEISLNASKNISNIFDIAIKNMEKDNANIAWKKSVDECVTNLNKEDKQVLKTLSKLLGQTDSEGQISQIEITQNFIDVQIKNAQEEKQKNEKLYSRLGTTIGLAIVIILF